MKNDNSQHIQYPFSMNESVYGRILVHVCHEMEKVKNHCNRVWTFLPTFFCIAHTHAREVHSLF